MHYRTPNIVTHNESFRSLEEIVASILAESEDILNEQQPQQQQGHEYIEVEVANDAQWWICNCNAFGLIHILFPGSRCDT